MNNLNRLATPGRLELQLRGHRINQALRQLEVTGLDRNEHPHVEVTWADASGFDAYLIGPVRDPHKSFCNWLQVMHLSRNRRINSYTHQPTLELPAYSVGIQLVEQPAFGGFYVSPHSHPDRRSSLHGYDLSFTTDSSGAMPPEVRAGFGLMTEFIKAGKVTVAKAATLE